LWVQNFHENERVILKNGNSRKVCAHTQNGYKMDSQNEILGILNGMKKRGNEIFHEHSQMKSFC
jgi:hypothetical protein